MHLEVVLSFINQLFPKNFTSPLKPMVYCDSGFSVSLLLLILSSFFFSEVFNNAPFFISADVACAANERYIDIFVCTSMWDKKHCFH